MQLITSAAGATFLRDGLHILETFGLDATTQQIQSVTGVSTTTLYRYFKNRETYLAESFAVFGLRGSRMLWT
jgi:AcrR family transcriptional regulator